MDMPLRIHLMQQKEGRLHTVSEGPITGLGEGWWLLPHTMKKHPELKTVWMF